MLYGSPAVITFESMKNLIIAVLAACAVIGCGDDDDAADRLGIGAECTMDDECNQEDGMQTCLMDFAGGYCGVRGCTDDADCPGSSACVTDPDFGGVNYCFRTCLDKPECNANRSVDNESNCVSSIDFVDPDGDMGRKVCRPPLSGSPAVDAGPAMDAGP